MEVRSRRLAKAAAALPVLATFALAVALGFEGTWALVQREPAEPGAAALAGAGAPSRAPAPVHALAGNPAGALELVGDPRTEIARYGRDAELRIVVHSRFEREATVRYAVELADELGSAVAPPFTSPILRLAAGGSAPIALPLPSGPGFYRYRVSAVGRAGKESADALVEVGLAASTGVVHVLDDEEWFTHSLANQGVSR